MGGIESRRLAGRLYGPLPVLHKRRIQGSPQTKRAWERRFQQDPEWIAGGREPAALTVRGRRCQAGLEYEPIRTARLDGTREIDGAFSAQRNNCRWQ